MNKSTHFCSCLLLNPKKVKDHHQRLQQMDMLQSLNRDHESRPPCTCIPAHTTRHKMLTQHPSSQTVKILLDMWFIIRHGMGTCLVCNDDMFTTAGHVCCHLALQQVHYGIPTWPQNNVRHLVHFLIQEGTVEREGSTG